MDAEQLLSGNILVVDDEEIVGQTLAAVIQHLGYHSIVATSFEEMKQCIEQQPIDLVTLDIVMPGTDGLAALKWLQEHHPEIGVVMATALGDPEAVIKAMRWGACDYLVKPFSIDLVEQQISGALVRQGLKVENRRYREDLEQRVAEQTAQLRQLNQQLVRQVAQLEARDRLVQFQFGYHSRKEAVEEILSVIGGVLFVEKAALYQVARPSRRLVPTGHSTEGKVTWLGLPGNGSEPPDWVMQGSEVARQALQEPAPFAVGREVAVSLKHEGGILGVLWVECRSEHEDDDNLRDMLQAIAGHCALVLWKVDVMAGLEADDLDPGELIGLR